MDLNASPIMKGDDEKKKAEEFERAYFRDRELRNIRSLSRISSINSTPLREFDQISSRPVSTVSSEVLAYSSNMRNVMRYANNGIDKGYVHGPIYTSSEKNVETSVLRNSNFESAIMPPPSTSQVQRSRISTNKVNYSPSTGKQVQTDYHQMSESDIFKTMEQQQSLLEAGNQNQNTRVFKQWTIMISKDGKLLVKGKMEEGVIARSKPIGKKLSSLKLESIYKHLYKLEGNLVDKKNELPPYVRDKFINGFPDDWQNVVVVWKHYLVDKHKSNFRWPTPASDSDHDDTPEPSNFEHNGSIPIISPDRVSAMISADQASAMISPHEASGTITPQPASAIECVRPNSIETPNLKCPTNGVVELLGKEKLIAFTKTLANNNVSPEFVNKFCEMMVCMNSLVTMQDYQNMLIGLTSNETKPSRENSISILNETATTTPQKTQPSMEKDEESVKEDEQTILSDDEDNNRCAGVFKIPSHIFQNRATVHRYPRRSRQAKRKFEHEVNVYDYPDDVSILTEYKEAMAKNQLANKNLKDDSSVEKDSGCHMMSDRKRRCTDDYDDAGSDIFESKLRKYKESSQPLISSIKNVSLDLNAMKKFGGKSPVKNVTASTEKPEGKSLVKNVAARKENSEEKSPVKNVAARTEKPGGKSLVKNVAARKENSEEKSPVKNVAARTDENKEIENAIERKSYCLRSEATERKSYSLRSEGKEKVNKENEAVRKTRKSEANKENRQAVEEKGQYGSMDHPKLLKSWKVYLVYDQRLKNQCGLVLEGTLMNEAGYVHSRKFQTDPLQLRISSTLVQTIKNEYFELEDQATNIKHVPKPLHPNLKNGLPNNLDEFCNKWKKIEDKNKSGNLDSTDNLDSTLKRQRRQTTESNFWIAAVNKEVQKSPPATGKVAKKLFPEKGENPTNSKTTQNPKKTKETKKAVPENPEPKTRGGSKIKPKCTYDPVYKERDYDVMLSDDYLSD